MNSWVLHVSACMEGTVRQNARLTLIGVYIRGVHVKLSRAGCNARRDAHHEAAEPCRMIRIYAIS